ncbi:unnamed protein product [Owenia fusiformis]|uniref:C-type lectin domain-containing protein n=1 Tax=Owenia fusiformis TaxID=6347 RepID=A0A8S4PFY7_OWEFU|nr:unnamed protein product [Owenia fusiformis]
MDVSIIILVFAIITPLKVLGTCPNGWLEYGTYCYEFNTPNTEERKTWTEARDNCGQKNSDLVSILSQDEQTFVFANIPGTHNGGGFWIGLETIGLDQTWKDGSTSSYINWADDEPNDDDDSQDCVEMLYDTGTWNDLVCSWKRNWICKGLIPGSCASDADCSREPFKKTCRVQLNSAGIRVCGDPHIRQTIKNSERPLCYDFAGKPGKTYLFLKDNDFEITARFMDSNVTNADSKLVEYISLVNIKKGPVFMTFDLDTITIAVEGKPIEKIRWAMGKIALPGMWMTTDKKRANVFLDDGNTTVNIIRKGASPGHTFLNFGLLENVMSTEANGILGDLRNKLVYTPSAYGKSGTIRWAGVSFPVHDDGTTCLKMDPFYELKFNTPLQIFQVD